MKLERLSALFVALLLLASSTSAFAQKAKPKNEQPYLPVDASLDMVGSAQIGIWDFSAISQRDLDAILRDGQGGKVLSFVDHGFSITSLDIAVKLGFNYISIAGSSDYSVLYAESRRYVPATAKLSIRVSGSNQPVSVSARILVGCAARVNILVNNRALAAALEAGPAGLEVKIRAINESMAFSAIGFTTYAPFKLVLNNNGSVDLAEIRKSVIEVFNTYVAAAGDLSNVEPKIIGFRVGPDFPSLDKVLSIRVDLISK